MCVSGNSLEKFFDSLNDLVLKHILPGLRISDHSPSGPSPEKLSQLLEENLPL